MAQPQKDNSGVLFKNKDRKNDNHPHAKGRAKVGGIEYWISAWTNTDRNGEKYQAFKFEPMENQDGGQDSGDQRQQPRYPRRQRQQAPANPIPESGGPAAEDIPF